MRRRGAVRSDAIGSQHPAGPSQQHAHAQVRLHVLSSNVTAQRFYTGLGFEKARPPARPPYTHARSSRRRLALAHEYTCDSATSGKSRPKSDGRTDVPTAVLGAARSDAKPLHDQRAGTRVPALRERRGFWV
jgi:hypothetical protein